MKNEIDSYCAKCKKDGVCISETNFCKCELKYSNNSVKAFYKECGYENKGVLKTYFFEGEDDEMFFNASRGLVLSKVKEFLDEYSKGGFVKGIYLYGPYGSGKSFILYNLAKKLVSQGKKVIYAYYPDLIREIKSSLGEKNFEKYILELKKVDVLMLDDVGAENNTAFVRDEILGPVLQYRMNHDLPLFATSNINIEMLTTHFAEANSESDRVKASRIIERMKYLMVPMELKDIDYRKTKKN